MYQVQSSLLYLVELTCCTRWSSPAVPGAELTALPGVAHLLYLVELWWNSPAVPGGTHLLYLVELPC